MSHEAPEAFPRIDVHCNHGDDYAELLRATEEAYRKATRERDEAITALLDMRTERDAAIKRGEEVRDAAHASTNALRFAALDALGVIPQPPEDAEWNECGRGLPTCWQDDGTFRDAHRITAEAVRLLAAHLHQAKRRAVGEPILSLTAEVVEAGGTGSRKPGVTLDLDGKAITLLCTPAQAREVATHLYHEVTLTLSPAPATVPTDGAGEGVP